MDNNVFLNDDFSNKDTKKDSTDLNKADRLTKLEKSIAAVYEAVFEIDVNKNSVYNVFIKKNTNLYNEFSCNKMSYPRLCRLIVTEIADSSDVEKMTDFLNPARIKKVKNDKNGVNEERIQFRAKNKNAVLWKECRIVYYREDASQKELCTLKDITYDKNFELKYNAQTELINATQKSEREITKSFINAVKSVCKTVVELNYSTLECFEFDFSGDSVRKKSVSKDLKEHIKHFAHKRVYPDDVQKFVSFFSMGNIVRLSEKRIRNSEIKLRLRDSASSKSDYEWYILSGNLSKNDNRETILTVFFKNINKHETERIEILKQMEVSLSKAGDEIKNLKQYRKTLIEGSYYCVSASVDKDIISNDCKDVNGNSLLKTVGLSAPCKLSEFAKRWIERYIIKSENSMIDTGRFNLDMLKDAYNNGNRFYKGEYKIIATTGKIRWLECYTLLVRSGFDNELMMFNFALDITDEKRRIASNGAYHKV